ncbi:phosphate uptake regulator, PhoU [Nocardia sp. CDC159]|uniref:Phosphate uptake regulator, PhoU n=1 Tax=Nocardia pulmonis TaxID=2951408 RepID=A0A9X2E9T2_9NOCA|nr:MULTISPECIES: PhoU domain-containing protein [Nocardia]MCM6776939.1 phosphate uptake regulator, PhoU [Nocardia pulmonis]MCM6789363.1 phosphate uptake regulator, PhoU [Nocardia sp. CDC159]
MRTKFSSELVALTRELGRLAGLAHEATERVAVAVTDADLTAAYEVFALDERLQETYGACENRAVILLALEAPVARDLRHVVSAIQITEELSRLGWLTSRIADSVVRRYPQPVAPPELIAELGEIGRRTTELAARTVAAIGVDQPTGEAEPVASDPALHAACQQVLQSLAAPDWPHGSAMAVDLALLVHHYERCADRCVRIGRLIRFLHTGIPLSAQISPDSTPA